MNDFYDWLNPILVKELRQGLRSRVFVVSLLAGVLGMGMVTMFVATGEAVVLNDAIKYMWTVLGGVLMVVLPGAALGDVRREIREKTLELLLITRLSPWQIAMGKWLARVALSGLVVCAVLPFLVIQYFMGGVNLIEALETLWLCFLCGGVLTALALALSGYLSSGYGCLPLILFAGCGVVMGPLFLYLMISLILLFEKLPFWADKLLTVTIGGVLALLFLSIAANRVADEAAGVLFEDD